MLQQQSTASSAALDAERAAAAQLADESAAAAAQSAQAAAVAALHAAEVRAALLEGQLDVAEQERDALQQQVRVRQRWFLRLACRKSTSPVLCVFGGGILCMLCQCDVNAHTHRITTCRHTSSLHPVCNLSSPTHLHTHPHTPTLCHTTRSPPCRRVWMSCRWQQTPRQQQYTAWRPHWQPLNAQRHAVSVWVVVAGQQQRAAATACDRLQRTAAGAQAGAAVLPAAAASRRQQWQQRQMLLLVRIAAASSLIQQQQQQRAVAVLLRCLASLSRRTLLRRMLSASCVSAPGGC